MRHFMLRETRSSCYQGYDFIEGLEIGAIFANSLQSQDKCQGEG